MARPVLVLVPGITGSALNRRLLFGRALQVWLNPAALLAGHFPWLRLPTPGGLPIPAGQPDLLPGYPLASYYGLLQIAMARRGWEVVSAVDDWRYPAGVSAQRLLQLIRDRGAVSPVHVIAHSRGGLVTRYVLGRLDAAGQLPYVRRVVALGTPHVGSLAAWAYLACYAQAKRRIEKYGSYLPSRIATHYSVPAIAGTVRSWQSVYELLPDPVRSWLPSPDRARVYDPETWSGTFPPVVPAYLSAASSAWASLPMPPQAVEWYDVAGTGSGAYFGVPPVGRTFAEGWMTWTDDGDNTVPVVSATATGRPHVLTPTSHEQLPQDGRLWDIFDSILRGGLSASVTLPGAVLNNVTPQGD